MIDPLPPLAEKPRPSGVAMTHRPPAPTTPHVPETGPGTALKEFFAMVGIAPETGCACQSLANRMNALGVDGCRREAANIVADIRERAKAYPTETWLKAAALAVANGVILNPLNPFPGVLALAIRNAEKKLTQINKTDTPVATKTPPSAKTPTWAYGVITTPHRLTSHLPQTIASLRASGFDTPILGVDGAEDSSPWRAIAQQVVTRWPSRGNFANWWLTAQEVYLSNPHAEMYAMFEDDLIISAGAREYLERTCTEDEVYYNLYTFPENQRRASAEYTGWFDSNQRGLGAVGLVFRRDPFLKLLSTAGMLHHAADPIRGKERVDGIVVSAFTNHQIVERCHTPSIIQHTGDISVLKHGEFPKATSFRGEAFDLTSLIR
jgi:hypothetical protein